MDRGYIKLYRCIADDELWTLEPFTKAQAWIDLILLANHKGSTFSVRGNIVQIERGQLGRSETYLAERWRWSRDKVRRFLSYLAEVGKIRQQKSRIISIITIVKYDEYQETRQQKNNRQDNRKTTDKTTDKTTYNKQEECKECKEVNIITSGKPDPLVVEVVDYLNAKSGKEFKSTTKNTIKLIKARAKSGATIDDFKHVIDKKCDDWLGTNMEKYIRPDTLFNEKKFEAYRNEPDPKKIGTGNRKDSALDNWLESNR